MTPIRASVDLMEPGDWERLLAPPLEGPRLTVTMPTFRRGTDTTQNPVRLKNLLRKAEEKLGGFLSTEERMDWLAPAWRLQEDFEFHQHQSEGLVMALSKQSFASYRVPYRVGEKVHLGRHFFVRPLVPLRRGDNGYFVLTLDAEDVHLYRGGRFRLEEMDLGDAPTSIQEITRLEVEEESVQFHSGTGTTPPGEQRRAMFHGQGAAGDDASEKEKLLDFFRQVDSGVGNRIRGTQDPLVLVGEERNRGLYREATGLRTIHEEDVSVHPESLSLEEIHQRALGVVGPLYESSHREALAELERLAGQDHQKAAVGIEEVAPAAANGRVQTLLFSREGEIWGQLAPDRTEVEVTSEPGYEDEELINLAVIHTLEQGGDAWESDGDELPVEAPVAAILRY